MSILFSFFLYAKYAQQRVVSEWDFADTTASKLLQRYYLRSEFVHIVRQYLSFRPESDEKAAFVRERRCILEERLKVSI